MVDLLPLELEEDMQFVHDLLTEFVEKTQSIRAQEILSDWPASCKHFIKVCIFVRLALCIHIYFFSCFKCILIYKQIFPKEYQKALELLKAEEIAEKEKHIMEIDVVDASNPVPSEINEPKITDIEEVVPENQKNLDKLRLVFSFLSFF